jgi:AraC family transcriptional regulator
MKARRAEQNYRERVARVVAAIVASPMSEYRLEDLAHIAHFSPFHFHRVYRRIAGETVATTIRRVRLALATRLLESGDGSITQVALAVGYDSPQAFARAFGQFTGQSPSAFQKHMHRANLDAGAHGDAAERGSASHVRIIERPKQRVYALRHQGPLSTIPHTQRRLHLLAGQRGVLDWLGASFGDPDHTADFRYFACAASPEPWPADAEVEVLDIPAGRYALHCLSGPYARINAAVNALYSRWLPISGYEPGDGPTLERYLNSPRTASSAQLRTELLIPIRSANAL